MNELQVYNQNQELQLPQETKEFLKTIEQLVGIPVTRFSVGPDRTQTIDIEK